MEIDFSPAIDQIEAMVTSVVQSIPNIVVALLVFFLFILLGRFIRGVVTRAAKRYRRHNNLSIVLGRLAQWIASLIGLLIAFVIVFPNFSPADVIGLLGVSSVAIGFAFRDILQNFIAGILLLITEPFRIGDQIVVGDYEGTVEYIETRATTIRTYDSRRVVIPNGDLFTQSVIVNTAFDKRRVEYDLGIGYGDDIRLAKQLILDVLVGMENILQEPKPDVLVMELGEYSVVLRVRWWIQPPNRMDALDTRDKVLTQIKETLVGHGIDLPFPTYQLLFHDQTEDADGNRRKQREGWPPGQKSQTDNGQNVWTNAP
jgi:small conductance mechanosensitive channel